MTRWITSFSRLPFEARVAFLEIDFYLQRCINPRSHGDEFCRVSVITFAGAEMTLTNQRLAVAAILVERRRQDDKWGVQFHDLMEWSAILSEEVGELAHEMLEAHFGVTGPVVARLRAEAVQVAAVALAIIEAVDDDRIIPHRHIVGDGCP